MSDENLVMSDEKKLTKQGLRVLSYENITKKSSQTEVLLWVPHILSYGWWKLSYITQFSQNPNSPKVVNTNELCDIELCTKNMYPATN